MQFRQRRIRHRFRQTAVLHHPGNVQVFQHNDACVLGYRIARLVDCVLADAGNPVGLTGYFSLCFPPIIRSFDLAAHGLLVQPKSGCSGLERLGVLKHRAVRAGSQHLDPNIHAEYRDARSVGRFWRLLFYLQADEPVPGLFGNSGTENTDTRTRLGWQVPTFLQLYPADAFLLRLEPREAFGAFRLGFAAAEEAVERLVEIAEGLLRRGLA